jgi:hypothetical protein
MSTAAARSVSVTAARGSYPLSIPQAHYLKHIPGSSNRRPFGAGSIDDKLTAQEIQEILSPVEIPLAAQLVRASSLDKWVTP